MVANILASMQDAQRVRLVQPVKIEDVPDDKSEPAPRAPGNISGAPTLDRYSPGSRIESAIEMDERLHPVSEAHSDIGCFF